jgi:hypothetical protein
MADRVNNVVLVHGGFVDGSGWMGVFEILDWDGFNVSVVQNPTISLEGDVAATKMILDRRRGCYRSRHTRKGRGPGLYHGLCARRR